MTSAPLPAAGVGAPFTPTGTSITELVVGYIEGRATSGATGTLPTEVLAPLLARIRELEVKAARADELEAEVTKLRAHIERLDERIRELEIGIRRFVSERVAPEQLRLAFGDAATSPLEPDAGADAGQLGDATAEPESDGSTQQGDVAGDAATSEPATRPDSPTGEQASVAPPPSSADNAKRPPRRHNHGRRRTSKLARIVLEITPAEVQLKGLENFRTIGHEERRTLVRRRGGLVELIERRPKYVPVTAKTETPPSPSPGSQVDEAATPAETAPRSAQDDSVHVVLHESLESLQDTEVKGNPFVDGALVFYTPEPQTAAAPSGPVLIAPVPDRPINRGMADASLLAHLFVDKFDFHLPFYRQERETRRLGFPITRATMASWQSAAGDLLVPIADAAWVDALRRPWIATDATGTAIRAKERLRYGHVFVLIAPGESVLYRYSKTYDGTTVAELFGGYTGTVVADASANHNVLFGPGKAREAGCWSHARKPFVKALRDGEGAAPAFALRTIQSLFRIERELALLGEHDRLTHRMRDSAPIAQALFEWADRLLPTAPPDSSTRRGLVYLRNQREALSEFLRNGAIPIHNNACESALRHVVKGRRNWLSHGSDESAERACAITSLIASCELHGLDPEFYLQQVLTLVPSWPVSRALELAPARWLDTRRQLLAAGHLRYLDIARATGTQLRLR